jgi:hypothetical protein
MHTPCTGFLLALARLACTVLASACGLTHRRCCLEVSREMGLALASASTAL